MKTMTAEQIIRKEQEKITNKVNLKGTIISDFFFSHETYQEKFYRIMIRVARLSGQFDIIPLMVSDRVMDILKDYKGSMIEILGEFRSYNQYEGNKNRLLLSVFVKEWSFLEEKWSFLEEEEYSLEKNQIFLKGFICKEPIYRKTPLGREITELILVVKRPYGKSDYIPCITWGRNARISSVFSVGDEVALLGRVQSRTYTKKTEEREEQRTAYEVSVSKIERIK